MLSRFQGNSNIVNLENKVGAVGFLSVIFPDFLHERLLPLSVIKVNKDTMEPIRGTDGLCIKTKPGLVYTTSFFRNSTQ